MLAAKFGCANYYALRAGLLPSPTSPETNGSNQQIKSSCLLGKDLREDGGISRQHVYQTFQRYRVGHQGQFTVWGFISDVQSVAWSNLTKPHRRDEKGLTREERKADENPGIDFFGVWIT